MSRAVWFEINPIDWLSGRIKFPLGYYTYRACTCKSCDDPFGGKGLLLLFWGVRWENDKLAHDPQPAIAFKPEEQDK